jgi:hypothetical protein
MLSAPVASAELPGGLLARFAGADEASRAVRLLDFIKPVTTVTAPHMERISMGA